MRSGNRPKSNGLTPREQAFVEQYIADGRVNAAAAYQKISPQSKPATAKREAVRIMARPAVKAYLERFEQRVESKLIERVVIDRQWVLDQLVEIVHMAKQAIPVLDKDGLAIGVYQQNLPAANQALRMIGSEVGSMFIEKKETGRPGDFRKQSMTKDELRRAIIEKAAKLGMSVQLPKAKK